MSRDGAIRWSRSEMLNQKGQDRTSIHQRMAEIDGPLWEFNLAKVIVVDVTDDYQLMQPPLPTECYPVLKEVYLPRHGLSKKLARDEMVSGYLYDWHEGPDFEGGLWYVGVVREDLARELLASLA